MWATTALTPASSPPPALRQRRAVSRSGGGGWKRAACASCAEIQRGQHTRRWPLQKRPRQQRPFRHPQRSRLSANLVEAEQYERPQVYQRKQAKRIGEGEEGVDVHKYYVGALAVLNSRDKVYTPHRRH